MCNFKVYLTHIHQYMKKYFLLLVIFFASIHISHSQEKIFSENRIDDMTGKQVRRTVWATLKVEMYYVYYARLCQIDDYIYMDVKIMTGGSHTTMDSNANFIIKFENDSIIYLKNNNYVSSGKGDGAISYFGSKAEGINPTFAMTKDILKYFAKNPMKKIRFYFNDGYVETEVNANGAKTFQKLCARLYIHMFPS